MEGCAQGRNIAFHGVRKAVLTLIFTLAGTLLLPGLVQAGECIQRAGDSSCVCSSGGASCASGGQTVVKWTCDGRQNECRENETYPWSSAFDTTGTPCGKTVQIDVFDRYCRVQNAGSWLPECNNPSALKSFTVWYSGECVQPTNTPVPTSTPIRTPTPRQIQCNTADIRLAANPNPATIGQTITFSIPQGDASTWIDENWSGGVSNCRQTSAGSWNNLRWQCTASTAGTYTWTHYWKRCEGSVDNCSQQCSLPLTYRVQAGPTATPTHTPTPTRTPTPGPSATPTPTTTSRPTATPAPTASPGPTVTPAPTSTPTPTATSGPTSTPAPTPTPRPVVTTTPSTGAPLWLETAGLVGLGWSGWKLRRLATAFWR